MSTKIKLVGPDVTLVISGNPEFEEVVDLATEECQKEHAYGWHVIDDDGGRSSPPRQRIWLRHS